MKCDFFRYELKSRNKGDRRKAFLKNSYTSCGAHLNF